MLIKCLYVGLGGFVGAIGRFGLGELLHPKFDPAKFPLATLSANVIGCLLFGLGYGLTSGFQSISEEMRLLLFVGVLGGFTTYSSFGFETIQLVKAGNTGTAVAYIGLSMLLGIGAVWAGMAMTGSAKV